MTNFNDIKLWLFIIAMTGSVSCVTSPHEAQAILTTGIGINLEEAKNDAIRQAIQYQVGSYVTSDIEANKDTITKDVLTDSSGAIVERFEILSQIRRADGLYAMKARVRLVGDASRQSNRSVISKPKAIDGQSMQAGALSYFQLRKNAEQTWSNILHDLPKRAFKYEIINLGIKPLPNETDRVKLGLYAVAHWRMDFVTELRSALKNTARQASVQYAEPFGIDWRNQSPNEQQTGLCLADGFRRQRQTYGVECYIIDVDTNDFKSWLCSKQGFNLTFHVQGLENESLKFNNVLRASVLPYIDTDRNNGHSLTYIFYIVDDDMLAADDSYQSAASSLWTVHVPVIKLPNIKNISTQLGCG
jgi:hypothetical protein